VSRVSKNILFNLVGQALIVALGFLGIRLVFGRLGADALGILYFALAFYAVLTPLLDMGLSSTLVREVAGHLKTDATYVFRLNQTSSLFYWCSYALFAGVVWMAAPWLVSHWISLGAMHPSVAIHSLRILALALLLMLPRSLYSNLLRGVQRMEFNNVIDVGTAALHQSGTIVVVLLGGGLVEIAYCYLATLLLSNIAYILVAARFFPWQSLLPGFSIDVIRRNFSFTAHMAAFAFLAMIQMESDKVLVSKFLPIGVMGFYGVAQTLVARVSRVPAAINQASYPNFSALFHRGDSKELLREYRRLQDLVCYSLVPVFAAIIFVSRPLFAYLLSAQAAQSLVLPTALLCLGWYMNGTLNTPFTLSLAMGRPDINARQNFYALFLVAPVTGLLIWKWGLVGAGLSSVFYHIFAYSYSARRWASECIGIAAWDWYKNVLRTLALGAATYGSVWVVLKLVGQASVLSLALGYAFATVFYMWGAFLAMGRELRDGFLGWRMRLSGAAIPNVSSG
jgi:O-antigen/teichoic acid export membrane protein